MRHENGIIILAGQLAYIQEVDADEEYEVSERGEIVAFRAAPCEAKQTKPGRSELFAG